jgi:hypothetical protein
MVNCQMTVYKMEITPKEYGPKYVHIAGKNNIVAGDLSRLKKDEDEKLSEREEGLVLSHAMCTVEQNEAISALYRVSNYI